MIHCGEAKGKHTAVLIAQNLDEVLENLDLGPDMFTAITTDNANNMLNATQKKAKNIDMGLGCLDHILQLIVNRSIDKVPELKAAIGKFKRLATSTHKSSLAIQRIKKECADLDKSAEGPKGKSIFYFLMSSFNDCLIVNTQHNFFFEFTIENDY